MMVRDFQAIIGWETRQQILEKRIDFLILFLACIGGSNAIGMFSHFIDDEEVNCIGIEAGGLGIETDKHGCSLKRKSRNSSWAVFLFVTR